MWDFTEAAGQEVRRTYECPPPCPHPDSIDVDDRPYLWDLRST